jgi:hypothetical protein
MAKGFTICHVHLAPTHTHFFRMTNRPNRHDTLQLHCSYLVYSVKEEDGPVPYADVVVVAEEREEELKVQAPLPLPAVLLRKEDVLVPAVPPPTPLQICNHQWMETKSQEQNVWSPEAQSLHIQE